MGPSYTYFPEFDENDFLQWYIYEKATEQIIASFLFEDDAQDYVEFLERGGAFAGFTPKFILNRVSNSTADINEAFVAEFA